ncbi:hypothetical protein SAMN05216298_0422 [Glycomyces sambucus]|uniref:Uncharacterized protein n=1 Tax=Glycomyces sambucus TaxID=380244 RepID=A0A1G9CN70_9ACTN|nr:hypothetical protein [Glycomyces sambucus]SDK52914.1 hypothetical protein SAMN05216298_0422 [Glycomyces sambucus]
MPDLTVKHVPKGFNREKLDAAFEVLGFEGPTHIQELHIETGEYPSAYADVAVVNDRGDLRHDANGKPVTARFAIQVDL